MFEQPVGVEFVVGRFSWLYGEACFTCSQKLQVRMDAIGLDPFAPDYWTYLPKTRNAK